MTKERTHGNNLGTGPEPFSDELAPATTRRDGRVDVIHGVYAHSLPLAGLTVRQARVELQERMNIPPDALAVVDGVEAGEDAVLREGQVLNFIKPAGEKGRPETPVSPTRQRGILVMQVVLCPPSLTRRVGGPRLRVGLVTRRVSEGSWAGTNALASASG